jgi:hypothetical protein
MTATPPRPARTGADLVVECLTAEEVVLVAGVPGTTLMDLIDSLARQHAVRFVHTRHEQVAGFLADGVSRAGALGVCLVPCGPGAAAAPAATGYGPGSTRRAGGDRQRDGSSGWSPRTSGPACASASGW